MDRIKVLQHIRDDHARLRIRLDAVEYLANDIVYAGECDIRLFVRFSELVLCELFDHMRWEEKHLFPVLRSSGIQGQERAARLADDHREQKRLMRAEFERLRDPTTSEFMLSLNLLNYLEILRRDMHEEESWLIEPWSLPNERFGF